MKWIEKLRKDKDLAKWPPTWIPFAMAIVLWGEGWVFPFEGYKRALYYLAGFALLYAIAHWNTVRILNRKP